MNPRDGADYPAAFVSFFQIGLNPGDGADHPPV